jgi:hypothetical protein
MAQGLNQLLT